MSADPPFKKTLWSQALTASDLLRPLAKPVPAERGEVLLNWDITPDDMRLIQAIVERGIAMWKAQGIQLDPLRAAMDISACHANGCPLELMRFLMSDSTDFVSDFSGIGMHIDNRSGKLVNDYKPIFRKRLQ